MIKYLIINLIAAAELEKDKSMEINLEKKDNINFKYYENEKNKIIHDLKFSLKESANIKQLAIVGRSKTLRTK